MKRYQFFNLVALSFSIFLLSLAACTPRPATPPSATDSVPLLDPEPTQENAAAPGTPAVEETLLVAFARDGDLQLWDSASNQSRTLVKAGDITTVRMSDDGQVIAFLRRSLRLEPELMEYVSLWVVNHDGTNPREL
ncbi:MAG TPA: hypothetical protein VFO91_16245, partial [Anaerolineales bacterium]|nr:hypothetical protein [Anaerolineales bacterium]